MSMWPRIGFTHFHLLSLFFVFNRIEEHVLKSQGHSYMKNTIIDCCELACKGFT